MPVVQYYRLHMELLITRNTKKVVKEKAFSLAAICYTFYVCFVPSNMRIFRYCSFSPKYRLILMGMGGSGD